MKLTTTHFKKNSGWSTPFPNADSPQTLILVFGAPCFADFLSPFLELKHQYPNSVIAGCSTAGEIFDDQVLDQSLVVSITQFKHTPLRFYAHPILASESSLQAGKEVTEHLIAHDLSSIFVLSDGLLEKGAAFIEGINSVLKDKNKESTIVTGGIAADNSDFQSTWVLVEGMPQSGYACGIGFYGHAVDVAYGSQGGWKAFGPSRTVTKSTNNILYELDNEPALKIYKNYLGKMAAGLPATGLRYPLSLTENLTGKKWVWTVCNIDEATQSLTFTSDIPINDKAQLMYATFDDLNNAAKQAASMLEINVGSEQPILVIAISCVGRRIVMAEDSGAELATVLDLLPKQTKQVGFYSYGELSPYGKEGKCVLYNQTMTLTAIYEHEL